MTSTGWKPGFGIVYTWFGMDKNGEIGVFVNDCWGELPSVLLKQDSVEHILDSISEYIHEESEVFTIIPPDKNGDIRDSFNGATGIRADILEKAMNFNVVTLK